MQGSHTRRTILITGAGGNLGRIVTQHMLEIGYRVIAVVHNENSKKHWPAQEGLDVLVADLNDEKRVELLVSEMITKYNSIEAALLLAGGFAGGRIKETGNADIRDQIRLNFETAYHVARPLFSHMLEKNYGRIVFIGARPAIKAVDGKNMVAYGLSKSLLFKLSEYINAEAKEKNVTATVLVPSTIDTEANRAAMPDKDPAKWVKPEEFASIMQFVLSENGAALKETVLKVYGGS